MRNWCREESQFSPRCELNPLQECWVIAVSEFGTFENRGHCQTSNCRDFDQIDKPESEVTIRSKSESLIHYQSLQHLEYPSSSPCQSDNGRTTKSLFSPCIFDHDVFKKHQTVLTISDQIDICIDEAVILFFALLDRMADGSGDGGIVLGYVESRDQNLRAPFPDIRI